MIGSDSDDDHCSEPMSTGKSHDRRAAPLEPQETFGRRAASTCSARFRVLPLLRRGSMLAQYIAHRGFVSRGFVVRARRLGA